MPRNTPTDSDDFDWSELKNLKNFKGQVDDVEEMLDEQEPPRKKKKRPTKLRDTDY